MSAPVPTTDTATGAESDAPQGSPPSTLRRLLKSRGGVVALIFLTAIVLIAVLAPWITPYDPSRNDLAATLAGPFSNGHILGTDDLGRDILSRIMTGSRISLAAAALATAIAVVIGLPVGLLAGYLGGAIDYLVMRINDALMTFPALVLAVAIVAFVGSGLTTVMIAIGVVNIPRVVRVVRALTISVREEPYTAAARSMGVGPGRVVIRHVLPNILSPVLVQISLTMAMAMIAESSLSFLGLGVQPPKESWGSMLSRSVQYFDAVPLYSIAPAVMLVATVLALNVLGEAIRSAIGQDEGEHA